jgi:hypothetical protein
MRHRAPGGPFDGPSVMMTRSTRCQVVTKPSKESSHRAPTVGAGYDYLPVGVVAPICHGYLRLVRVAGSVRPRRRRSLLAVL